MQLHPTVYVYPDVLTSAFMPDGVGDLQGGFMRTLQLLTFTLLAATSAFADLSSGGGIGISGVTYLGDPVHFDFSCPASSSCPFSEETVDSAGNLIILFGGIATSASYGHVFASVAGLICCVDAVIDGSAGAMFTDSLTVTGPSGTGFVRYLFDGSIASHTDFGENRFQMQQQGFAPEGVTYGPQVLVVPRSSRACFIQ